MDVMADDEEECNEEEVEEEEFRLPLTLEDTDLEILD